MVIPGNSRGRVYDTTDLAANFHHGVSSLTQPSVLTSIIDCNVLRWKILEVTGREN